MANILVVDDEMDILEMTSIMLEDEGYEVLTALNGETAIQIAKNNSIDLILLDAVMPGMNGLDVCRTLKRNIQTSRIPVILFSALGNGLDQMLDSRDKADIYLSKPYTRKVLLEKVSELLV